MSGLVDLKESELQSLMKEAFSPSGNKELTGIVSGKFLKSFGWSEDQIQNRKLCYDNGSVDENMYFVTNKDFAGSTKEILQEDSL
jgi:hypothetical protein